MKASRKFACLLFLLLLTVAAETRGQQTAFYLQDGDRVLFYGDSITEQSPYYAGYPAFVESYVVTRFPRLHIGFTNAGWAGDLVGWGPGGTIDERLRRDVFPYKPTVLTIMVGMNDGFYDEFRPTSFKFYSDGYERLLGLLRAQSAQLRITLLQPSPFDDFTGSGTWRLAPPPIKDGYNSVIVRYGEFVKELARKHELTVADMNAPMVKVLREALVADPAVAQKIIPDRIHPAAAGHVLMATELLKAWHAPAVVTSVEVDASGKRVLRAENTKIKELKSSDEISWTQTDDALPLPLDPKDPVIALVVKLSDIVESLDRQLLKVNGLRASLYALKIDGEEVGTWTREQLAAGINLAPLSTPMLKQAMAVHALTLRHNRIHFVRWREVEIPLKDQQASPAMQRTLAALDALEAELIRQQRALAQPQARHYELIEKAN
jgi:lysophospholipase L1-like esterase